MEWLTQNWIWIAVLIGVVAFLGFFRSSHGGHGAHGGGDGSTGRIRLGGCCGGHGKSVLAAVEDARVATASRREREGAQRLADRGEHGTQPPPDKPGVTHSHQH